MFDYKITKGKHKGEVAVVVEELEGGVKKVLTLGGILAFDANGDEICPWCLGSGYQHSIFGIIRCRCQWNR